jgi:hypothetical protein
VYSARVTLTAKTGYTFAGLAANSFTYTGATSVTNSANSGTVTITFPATEALSPVSDLTGTAGDGQVTLNWTDPADADLASIAISWTPGDGTASVPKGTQPYTVTGLTNGTAYTFTLTAVDTARNRSEGVSSEAITPRAPGGLVTVEFTGPQDQDETITLSQEPEAISWGGKTTLTVRVGGDFTAYRWALDGVKLVGATESSLSLNAEDLSVRQHRLTVFVTKHNGFVNVEYTKELIFTVQP